MSKFVKYIAAVALAGALALAAATPSEARKGRNAALIGGLAAGALIGAAVANANNGYYYGPGYYEPGYAYEPAYVPGYAYEPAYVPGYAYEPAYAPTYAPVYRGSRYYRGSSDSNCGGSPGTPDYRPCSNQ